MVRWGLLGTGRIAKKVLPIVMESPINRFVAVGSRSHESAQAFAKDFGIPSAYGSYQEVVGNNQIDAVYITLPNSLHFEWAYKALANGKHVLCEKPLAMTADETSILVQLAKDKNLILMDGFMYQFHKQTQTIFEILSTQKFGHIQSLYGCFHFQLSDKNNIRLQKSEGGGALRDVGCYLIHFLTKVIPISPSEIKTFGRQNNAGVDTQLSTFWAYPTGTTAHFTCSFESPRRDYLEVICERAHIIVDRPFKPDLSTGVTIITDEGSQHHLWQDALNPFRNQFDAFANEVYNKKLHQKSMNNYVLNAQLLDLINSQLEVHSFNDLSSTLLAH